MTASDSSRSRERIRVALVLSRSLDDENGFGRVKTLRAIHKALNGSFATTTYRLHHVLETRRFLDMLGIALRGLAGLLGGRPVPLQTLFYSSGSEIRRLVRELCRGDFQAIYLDSVRSQLLLRELRKRAPGCRIIVDFDDLMSRRMTHLYKGRCNLSLGFVQQAFPAPLRRLIEGPLSSLVARYEAAALRRAEREVAEAAEAIVLVSSAERDLLRSSLAPELRDVVHAIPPPAPLRGNPSVTRNEHRFVFLGSDRLLQNRLSIDFLVDLWERLEPATGLHIYGKQQRTARRVPNVHWHGFVDDLSDVYTPGSIMLLPALLAGGIKTKAIEAWSYGCPVLGNEAAFEGLDVRSYPLIVDPSEWAPYVLDPAAHADTWAAAARIGNEFVREELSGERFAARWRAVTEVGVGRAHGHSRSSHAGLPETP